MQTPKRIPRQYHRITKEQRASFQALSQVLGNGSAAVRAITPTILNPGERAFRILKKTQAMATSEFIDDQLQVIGVDAINRIGKLVNSGDERVATRNSQYVVDHIRGQATKKSIALTGKLNIQNVLD